MTRHSCTETRRVWERPYVKRLETLESSAGTVGRVGVEKQKIGGLVRENMWVTTKYGGEIDAEEAIEIS